MGNTESKERTLFLDIAKHLLKKGGVTVSSTQLRHFFQLIQECSPWFPDGGALDLKIWKQVGRDMKSYYKLYGNERVPKDAFALWGLFRDCFDTKPPAEQLERKLLLSPSSDQEPANNQVIAVSAENNQGGQDENRDTNETDDEEIQEGNDPDQLSPSDQEDLEEAAFRYHNEDYPPFVAPVTHRQKSS